VIGKPGVKRLSGTPICRRENIKMDLREIGLDGADWIHLAQDRATWWPLVNPVTIL
jgi:hypothetical protein